MATGTQKGAVAAKEVHPDTGSAREFWGAGQLQGKEVARLRGGG